MSWPENKKILVPVDFSESSLKAVETAVAIAADNSQITVIHVLQPMPAYDIGARYVADIDEQHAHKVRESLQQQLADSRFKGISIEAKIGNPPHEITEFAEANNFGLIVIPSHGRTGVTRLLVGSVAERVVRLAHCPVLVLRG
jgi:nucleotide-binding universal stress UspA family protein